MQYIKVIRYHSIDHVLHSIDLSKEFSFKHGVGDIIALQLTIFMAVLEAK